MTLPTAHEFLGILRSGETDPVLRYGHIHTSYSSGRPRVRFDGEDVAGTETYPRVSSYTPVANDRILLGRTPSGFVILGKVV